MVKRVKDRERFEFSKRKRNRRWKGSKWAKKEPSRRGAGGNWHLPVDYALEGCGRVDVQHEPLVVNVKGLLETMERSLKESRVRKTFESLQSTTHEHSLNKSIVVFWGREIVVLQTILYIFASLRSKSLLICLLSTMNINIPFVLLIIALHVYDFDYKVDKWGTKKKYQKKRTLNAW